MDIAISYMQGPKLVTVFRIQGDIDANSYEQLQARARAAFETGTRDLLLDLTEVPYVSSAGLRAIQYVFNLLRADSPDESSAAMSRGLRDGTFKSPHLKLFNPTPSVLEVIRTTGFDMFLEIHHDELEIAVTSF